MFLPKNHQSGLGLEVKRFVYLDLSEYIPALSQGANIDVAVDLTDILDNNSNEVIEIDGVTSAVNYVRATNAATGNNPELSAQGDDTNVGLTIKSKGTSGITADASSVTTGTAFALTSTAVTTGVCFDIDGAGLTTGKGIDLSNLAAFTTGKGIHIDATGTTHTTGILAHIDSAGTAIATTGRLLLVDHTGATTTSGTLVEFKTAANDETVLCEFDAASLTSGKIASFIGTALTTGFGIQLDSFDALTTGVIIDVESGATAITGAGRLIFSDHSGATTTSGVLNEFKSAATDETVIARVTATGALAAGVALDVSVAAMTTGTGLDMGGMDALTTGKGINIQSIGEALTSGILLDVGHTGSGSNADITGSIAKFLSSVTDTDTSGTNANDYDTVLISRTGVMNGTGGTMTSAGAALKIETTSTETAGTLTDSSYAIEIAHNARHDSQTSWAIKLNCDNPGDGAAGGIDFSAMADGEALFKLSSTDTDLSSKNPETDAEAGWFPVDVAGTVYAVPIYALS